MRLKIFHKLFLTLVLVTSMALLLLAASYWYVLDRGFLGYLREQDEESRQRLVQLLVQEYERFDSWDQLAKRHYRWDDMIQLAQREGLSSEELEQLYTLGEEDMRPPGMGPALGPGRRPDGRRRPPPRAHPPRRRNLEGDGPEGPPSAEERGRRDRGRRPGPGPPPGMPAPLRERLSLYDGDWQPVFGQVKPPEDVAKVPVEVGGVTVGWLCVAALHEASATHDLNFLKGQMKMLAFITLGLIFSAGLAGAFMARHFGRPITQLAHGARRLTSGVYGTRVTFEGRDELGELARDFNNLAFTLEQNEKSRQRWTADISHELRTPLAVMRGELEAVTDGVRPLSQDTVSSLHGEVMCLSKLVEDLYKLSLADIGALTYQKHAVDPREQLKQVSAAFAARLEKQQLRLELVFTDEPIRMLGDDNRLHQLFTNLMENSCRYTDAGGIVRWTVTSGDGRVSLLLDDTAPAPKQPAKLFVRLHREERSRTRSKGGAGLGLAICKTIVEAHGGTIDADLSALGGCRITILFPTEC